MHMHIYITCRHTKVYLEGVEKFLSFAFSNSSGNKILCPCKNCSNSFWNEEREVSEHLVCDGFLRGYKTWIFHRESSSSFLNVPDAHENEVEEESPEEDDISDLLRDLGGGLDKEGDFEDDAVSEQTDAYLEALQKLKNDSSQELYPGCKKFSKLRFIIRLLHVKLLGGWSDKSFNLLLDLLNDAFPEGSSLAKNYNEAKKLVKCLGLGYVNIHACEHDCILFWKNHAKANVCPICNTS